MIFLGKQIGILLPFLLMIFVLVKKFFIFIPGFYDNNYLNLL